MSRCEVGVPRGWRCDDEAVVRLEGGCVHEHLLTLGACARHSAQHADAARAGRLLCTRCLNATGETVTVQLLDVVPLEAVG